MYLAHITENEAQLMLYTRLSGEAKESHGLSWASHARGFCHAVSLPQRYKLGTVSLLHSLLPSILWPI
jgi:hypothetical protein